jgi:hypothetical protein
MPRVLHDVDIGRTCTPHLVDAVSGDDDDVTHASAAKCLNLAFEEREIADAGETLRSIANDTAETSSPSRRQDHCCHSDSSAGRSRTKWSIWSTLSK